MKKIQLIIAMMLMSIGIANAETTIYTGIIAVVNGSETSYALKSVPSVTFTNDANGIKCANLTMPGQSEPAAIIPLEDGKELSIIYGTYSSTDANGNTSAKVSANIKKGKSTITGGKLIVIGKDGKQYTTDGRKIQ